MTLTVADVRKHVTSPLEDPALQKLIDAAYEAIVQRAGAEGAVTDNLAGTSGPLLMLNRVASAITSVTENGTILDALDYQLRSSGRVLERLRSGPNPRYYWTGRVDVVYTPPSATAARDRVAIALVKLDVEHNPGRSSESIGDYAVSYADNSAMNYTLERESILESLSLEQTAIF